MKSQNCVLKSENLSKEVNYEIKRKNPILCQKVNIMNK